MERLRSLESSVDLTDEEQNDGKGMNKQEIIRQIQETNKSYDEKSLQRKVLLDSRMITDTNDGMTEITSGNYYGEVLFDYLELFYKQILLMQAQTYERLIVIQRMVDQKTLDQIVGKQFERFYRSILERRKVIEKQIDVYWNIIIRKEKEQNTIQSKDMLSKVQNQMAASPASGVSETSFSDNTKVNAEEYIDRIQYLNDNYDENSLQINHFPNNFRCKSFT